MSLDKNSRGRILELIANDTSGLLELNTPKKKTQNTGASIIERNLQEILDFAIVNGHLPKKNLESVWEYQLATRLENAKTSPEFDEILAKLDKDGLIKKAIHEISQEVEVNGLSDKFNLLSAKESGDIFNLVHVKPNSKLDPFHMSHRIRCLNFYEYEPLFNNIHSELANKTRRLVEFDPDRLTKGSFFVLSGVLGYIAKADVSDSKYEFNSGERNRSDGRTLCIFDNGTESRMLYRSLVKALQADGFLISEPRSTPVTPLIASDGDQSLGYIYVLKTLNSKLKEYEDLYKIGFTSGLVSSRISNCEKEATYLFSRVRVAATYRCYNINAATVEDQLHKAFEATRLDLELRDSQGNAFKPREWFQVPIEDIELAIGLIQMKNLESYFYDPKYGFVEKSGK